MKYSACFLMLLFIVSLQDGYTQYNYLGYRFLPAPYGIFNELTGGTISTATGDDGAENITLPFTFKYMGIDYTTARISVNGWLEMGQSYTGQGYENLLESTLMKPFIAPLWDDLLDDSQSEIRYQVIGEYPARIFVIQWKNLKWMANNNRKSFQVRLWETDNTIDFVYGPGTMSSNNSSYSVGLNNHTGGAGNFISITPAGIFMPEISTTAASNNNFDLDLLPQGTYYTFVPDDSSYSEHAIVYQVPEYLEPGLTDQKVLAVIISTHAGGILTSPWTSGFTFTTYGTTNTSDILSAKIYYTGSSPYYSTSNQVGTAYPNPDGEFTIDGSAFQINNNLTYFWLAYDISPDAQYGNLIDGNCLIIHRINCCPSIYPDSTLAGPGLTIIPVELTGFSARLSNSSVILNWETKTETNNAGFEIYRQYENNNRWDYIGFVNGTGTSSEPCLYSFTDDNIIEGSYSYRLKQIDYDGSFWYSDVIEINVCFALSYSLMQNYPNPFNPSTFIKFSLPENNFVTIKLYDILGTETALIVNEQKEAGEHLVKFNASGIPSGVYFYQITCGSFIQTRKMVIEK